MTGCAMDEPPREDLLALAEGLGRLEKRARFKSFGIGVLSLAEMAYLTLGNATYTRCSFWLATALNLFIIYQAVGIFGCSQRLLRQMSAIKRLAEHGGA
jgi:hypothetical protein